MNLWRGNWGTFQTKKPLAYTSLPVLSQELMKKLAHRKLVMVILRGNSAIKKFKQHIKWYTIPPPGGGKYEDTLTIEILIVTSPQSSPGQLPAQVPVKGLQGKLLNKRRPSSNGTNFSIPVRRELEIFRTKKDMILRLSTPMKCDTRGIKWGKLENTLAGNEQVNEVKYSTRHRYLLNQSSKFKVTTPLQSIIESRSFKFSSYHYGLKSQGNT